MLQYERFEIILNKLQRQSSVRVADLSRELQVSESTIRRDIADLAKAGRVTKVFGGAVAPEKSAMSQAWDGQIPSSVLQRQAEPGSQKRPDIQEMTDADAAAFGRRRVNAVSRNLQEKEQLQVDEKSEVASQAAKRIEAGDLVYIDAGTTTGSMIDHITCADAVFVTNGARHAIRLAQRGLEVYLLAGRLKVQTEAVVGHEAVDSLQKYHFTKCFIGTDGVDKQCGLTTADIEESMVKSRAIERSAAVFILADSSKFGLVASITFAPLESGTIITDQLPDPEYRGLADVMELHGEAGEK